MVYANKFCDLIALNFLTLIFSIPVITIGASSAAMHYVLLKIFRDELVGGVFRSFLTAFKTNFKQATLLWLIYMPIGLLIVLDLLLFHKGLLPLPAILKYLLIVLGIVCMISMNWSLILQSRYDNSVKATIRNSLLFCLFHPLDSLLISAVLCIPVALIVLFPQVMPIIPFCGFALPGILSTAMYQRIFIRHEQTLTAAQENTKSLKTD